MNVQQSSKKKHHKENPNHLAAVAGLLVKSSYKVGLPIRLQEKKN